MSGNRTAFARVPRGGNKDPAKIKSEVRIDNNWLAKLQHASMNPDLSTVMTKTESSLSVVFNAQGNVGYSLKNNEGKVLADSQDINRIQTLGSFITKERKNALNDEVGTNLKFTLAAFVTKGLEIGSPISVFHKSFIGVYRTINQQFDVIVKNTASLDALSPAQPAGVTIKMALIEFGRRATLAIGDYLFHRASLGENETPKKLNGFLRERRVPVYIYNKLTTAINTAVQGFDVRSLIFPKDPTKGMYLTYREMKDTALKNDLMGLNAGSGLAYKLCEDDALIRLMTNIAPQTRLDTFDETSSIASKLAGTPFFMVPFPGAVDTVDIFNFLAKNGVRGVTWNSGTVLSPPDLFKFYGTIAKRAYYGLINRPQVHGGLLGEMFPGFTPSVAEDEKRDLFTQLKAWSQTPGAQTPWFTQGTNWTWILTNQAVVKKVLYNIAGVNNDHAIAIRLAASVTTPGARIAAGTTMNGILIFTEVKNLAITLRETRRDPDAIIGNRLDLAPQAKKKVVKPQRAGQMERSMLTSRASSALAILQSRGYKTLAQKLGTWFCLFIDTAVQEAVADVFLARLDAFVRAPLPITSDERAVFMEPDDPDDTIEEDGNEPENPDD